MNNTTRDALLPCPFCNPTPGNLPQVIERRAPKLGLNRYHYSVKHPLCGSESGHHLTREGAIDKWNRRAAPPRASPTSAVDEAGFTGWKNPAPDASPSPVPTGICSTATIQSRPSPAAGWQIATDDDVEKLARECGWNNRHYMNQADYAEWCRRMRLFVIKAAAPAPPKGEA